MGRVTSCLGAKFLKQISRVHLDSLIYIIVMVSLKLVFSQLHKNESDDVSE